MQKKLTSWNSAAGMTMISPVTADPVAFHNRLLLAGLRFAPVPVRTRLQELETGMVLSAHHETCTGYLFGTDGTEVPETDLYGFLSSELTDGGWITISGHYRPTPEEVVSSSARFAMLNGQLMVTEERVLHREDGTRELLRGRSDLEFDNVVPFRTEPTKFGYGV
jgi:hypothetical protein